MIREQCPELSEEEQEELEGQLYELAEIVLNALRLEKRATDNKSEQN